MWDIFPWQICNPKLGQPSSRVINPKSYAGWSKGARLNLLKHSREKVGKWRYIFIEEIFWALESSQDIFCSWPMASLLSRQFLHWLLLILLRSFPSLKSHCTTEISIHFVYSPTCLALLCLFFCLSWFLYGFDFLICLTKYPSFEIYLLWEAFFFFLIQQSHISFHLLITLQSHL